MFIIYHFTEQTSRLISGITSKEM